MTERGEGKGSYEKNEDQFRLANIIITIPVDIPTSRDYRAFPDSFLSAHTLIASIYSATVPRPPLPGSRASRKNDEVAYQPDDKDVNSNRPTKLLQASKHNMRRHTFLVEKVGENALPSTKTTLRFSSSENRRPGKSTLVGRRRPQSKAQPPGSEAKIAAANNLLSLSPPSPSSPRGMSFVPSLLPALLICRHCTVR